MYAYPCVECSEDYSLEILFLECWSRASEMDFFEVHVQLLLLPNLYIHVLCLNSFGTAQFQSGSTAVSSLSTLHMVSNIFVC